MILQFGSGKGLIYSNEDILIFRNFTYLKLSDVTIETFSKSNLAKFDEHLAKREKLLCK